MSQKHGLFGIIAEEISKDVFLVATAGLVSFNLIAVSRSQFLTHILLCPQLVFLLGRWIHVLYFFFFLSDLEKEPVFDQRSLPTSNQFQLGKCINFSIDEDGRVINVTPSKEKLDARLERNGALVVWLLHDQQNFFQYSIAV